MTMCSLQMALSPDIAQKFSSLLDTCVIMYVLAVTMHDLLSPDSLSRSEP